MVLHMTDVEVPKNIPGVQVKPIVVKLEEASLSIIKELKFCRVYSFILSGAYDGRRNTG